MKNRKCIVCQSEFQTNGNRRTCKEECRDTYKRIRDTLGRGRKKKKKSRNGSQDSELDKAIVTIKSQRKILEGERERVEKKLSKYEKKKAAIESKLHELNELLGVKTKGGNGSVRRASGNRRRTPESQKLWDAIEKAFMTTKRGLTPQAVIKRFQNKRIAKNFKIEFYVQHVAFTLYKQGKLERTQRKRIKGQIGTPPYVYKAVTA